MMTDGNYYTDFFEKIMEVSRWTHACDTAIPSFHEETITEKKRVFLFFHKNVTTKVVVPDKEEDQIEQAITNLINDYDFLFPTRVYMKNSIEVVVRKSLTYKMLWDFCDFVKLAEYVIFYPNSKDGNFYVEAQDFVFKRYKEDEKKAIIIKESGLTVRIELECVEEKFSSNTMNIIKLIIERNHSEKQKQIIICEDEVSDDNIDCKDTMLLSNLSDFIYDSCYTVFKDITNSIIAGSGVKLE